MSEAKEIVTPQDFGAVPDVYWTADMCPNCGSSQTYQFGCVVERGHPDVRSHRGCAVCKRTWQAGFSPLPAPPQEGE